MQALVMKILSYVLTLPFLAGYRTYLVAAGLLGMAVYQLSVGNVEQAVTNFLGFLAAVGVRLAVANGTVAAKAPVVLVALFLAAAGGFAADPLNAKAPQYDPYGYADYAAFFDHVKNGGTGVLYVGVKDESVGTYQAHCRVKSGFKGLADGLYDCRHPDTPGGCPTMTKRAAVVGGFTVTPIYVGPPGPNFLGPTPSVFPLTPVQMYGGCANGSCSGGR